MENEKRLIDANALLKKAIWGKIHQGTVYESDAKVVTTGAIITTPTVDAVEVVHGRWIPIIDEPTPLRKMPMLSGYKCSVCGRYEEEEEPYCNCGAKMNGDTE